MSYDKYIEDITIAQQALANSKLLKQVEEKRLLCEVYWLPAHNHQTFYLQVYENGNVLILLWAKTLIGTYNWGSKIVMYSFRDAIAADKHPANKGSIFCGMKLMPKTDKTLVMLLSCLPKRNELTNRSGFVLDGTPTLVRNCQTQPTALLAYHSANDIRENVLSDEQREFMEELGYHIEDIIGNLLNSCDLRRTDDWIALPVISRKRAEYDNI